MHNVARLLLVLWLRHLWIPSRGTVVPTGIRSLLVKIMKVVLVLVLVRPSLLARLYLRIPHLQHVCLRRYRVLLMQCLNGPLCLRLCLVAHPCTALRPVLRIPHNFDLRDLAVRLKHRKKHLLRADGRDLADKQFSCLLRGQVLRDSRDRLL